MTVAALERIALDSGTILGDEVFDQIGNAIIDGRLAPGARLRDVDLAAQLGVSRTPVREALQRLELIGLVEVAVGRYTRVSHPDDQLRADTREFVVYTIGAAMRMATERCPEDEWREFLLVFDELIDVAEDPVALVPRSIAVYQALTKLSGNRFFIGVMREASFAFRRNLAGWRPFLTDPVDRKATYVALRDALAARDGRGAETIFRAQHGIV